MADITPNAGDFVRPHKSPWGAFPTRSMKYSTGISSAVVRVGQLVVLDTGSTSFTDCIIPCATSSNTLNPSAGTIVGFAAENSTSQGNQTAQGTVVPVWEANPLVEFRARTRGGLLNSTIVGQPKELTRDSTMNIDLVDLKSASSLATPAKCVIVTGLIDNSGDSGGAVTFRFNTSSGFLAFFK